MIDTSTTSVRCERVYHVTVMAKLTDGRQLTFNARIALNPTRIVRADVQAAGSACVGLDAAEYTEGHKKADPGLVALAKEAIDVAEYQGALDDDA